MDRENVLQSTFIELESITDYHVTFEIAILEEMAKDFGRPRKEWITIVNKAIKEKYFDNGLRDLLADEYFFVCVMIAKARF